MKQLHLPIGLRTFKTALAVTLALFLVRLYSSNSDAAFYASFGALVAMDTTLDRSLRQGLTQLIGVLVGTIFGYVVVHFIHTAVPFWIVGCGVLLLIILCNTLRVPYAISLSCIMFLSACFYYPKGSDLLQYSALRLANTATGLAIALAVNISVRPYNNKNRIFSLLQKLRKQIPQDLQSIVVQEQFPDIQPAIGLLRRIDQELSLYRSQQWFHRKHDDTALLAGCLQLAERMVQELEAICGMDTLGDLASDNAERLCALGLKTDGLKNRKCTRQDTIVMNYHLDKLLSAYDFLGELMETGE